LLELRVKEIIYYLFDNLFVFSSSLGLIYVAEECSSMISSYQLQERGRYVIEANELVLLEILSSQWNGSSSAMATAKEEQEEDREEQDKEKEKEEPELHVTTDSCHVSVPQPRLYRASVSEAKLPCSSPVSSTYRPQTAGDALRSSESTVVPEETASEDSFLKSSIQWVKKRFTFKRKKSQTSSHTSSGAANEVMEGSQGSQRSRDGMTSMERSRSTSAPAG
jgi:hypothetical protein